MVSFCVAKRIGDLILPVSTMLQTNERDLTEACDIVESLHDILQRMHGNNEQELTEACDIVESLHDILQRMRGNNEQEFHDIFTNASELAADLDIHLQMSRIGAETNTKNKL